MVLITARFLYLLQMRCPTSAATRRIVYTSKRNAKLAAWAVKGLPIGIGLVRRHRPPTPHTRAPMTKALVNPPKGLVK